MHTSLLPLLLITVLAVVVPVLASRLRIVRLPIVVGEILAGILIGRSGLNLVEPGPTLTFLAEFGFTFLMFLSGLEVNFDVLRSGGIRGGESRWRKPLPLALLSFAGTVVLALAAGFLLSGAGLARSPLLMGLILSTTSLGIVVPILKERRLTGERYGQALLVAALVADFMTLLLLSVVIAVLSRGFSPHLLLFMVLLAAFFAAVKLGQWAARIPLLARLIGDLSHATAQIRVRGALALMVFWVVLAEALGVEVILGAFLAGAVISLIGRGKPGDLLDKLDAIGYGFFIPIFFINVGANFDLRALLAGPNALVLLPALVLAAYAVKVVPALLYRSLFPWRETLAAGALLSSRLSLIIAASAIALELNLITAATNSAVILVAIITCTLSPILFHRILPVVKEHPRQGVVVLGTDQLARLLARRLLQGGEPVCVVGKNQENLDMLGQNGLSVVTGDPADPRVLAEAGLENARALISLTSQPDVLVRVCRTAVEQFRVPVVIARADDPELIARLQQIPVQVVQSSLSVALAIEVALDYPTAFSILVDKYDGVELRDVQLSNPALVGLDLRRIHLAGNALVIGIKRQGEVIVPHGDTVLAERDTLMLLGSVDALNDAGDLLNGHVAGD